MGSHVAGSRLRQSNHLFGKERKTVRGDRFHRYCNRLCVAVTADLGDSGEPEPCPAGRHPNRVPGCERPRSGQEDYTNRSTGTRKSSANCLACVLLMPRLPFRISETRLLGSTVQRSLGFMLFSSSRYASILCGSAFGSGGARVSYSSIRDR